MPFVLGKKSRDELYNPSNDEQVHPQLILYVERAIVITPVDFSVHDGLRTLEEQKEYVRSGVSKTLNSYHLPKLQPGGECYGFAVDLVPYINGKLRWEWEPIYKVIGAMHQAEQELRPKPSLSDLLNGNSTLTPRLRWGGVWDKFLGELDPHDLEGEREKYKERRRKQGRKAFSDGPHLQLEFD